MLGVEIIVHLALGRLIQHLGKAGDGIGCRGVFRLVQDAVQKIRRSDQNILIRVALRHILHAEHGLAHLEAETIHALLDGLGLVGAGLTHGGRRSALIAVHPHAVAELAAQHPIDRNAVSLARQIPQRNFQTADAAALAALAAELLDLAEQAIHVAGVLAEQTALEHRGIGGRRAVADLAHADQALIGINFDQNAVHRGRRDMRKANVGDLQLAGARTGAHMRQSLVIRSVHEKQPPSSICNYIIHRFFT